MAALVDTNVLVYRFGSRFTEKQKIATEILRRGIAEDSVRVPHQAIIEFVAAVTRPFGATSFSNKPMRYGKRKTSSNSSPFFTRMKRFSVKPFADARRTN